MCFFLLHHVAGNVETWQSIFNKQLAISIFFFFFFVHHVYEIMVQKILFTANASFVDTKWRAPRLYDEKHMQNGSFVA